MKRLKKRIEEVNDKANRTAFYRNSLQDLLLVLKSKHVLMIIAFILLLSCTRAVDAECPAGFSCENGAVTPCEPGWYSLKGEVSCKRCRPGTYCEKTTEPPMDCKDGEYSQWSFTKCELCPAGYVCKLYNGETQFMRCPMGQFTKVGGTECLPTPPGYMSASPAQEPMACFDGYFTTTMNSTYCNLCPRGYQCKEKDKEPSICPEGTYSGQGSTECTKCPENMFCPEGSSYPRECPIDNPNCWVDKVPNEIETVTDTGKRNLQTCTGGNYWDGYNCQTCPEGYTCAAGTNITPSRCGTDTYSAAGATSCTSCGSNYICPTPRSSDRYQCQAGFVKSGTLYCRPCAEGKYCPDGANEYSCNPAAGTRQYSPGGLSACLSCPASTECTQYSYIDCTEGFYYESSTQLCTECPTGYYCQNNVKTACSAGEYQPYKGFSFCFQCPVMTKCPTTALSAYTACASNSEWSAPGSTSCTSCELNYECFVGYSVPCKSNYYSAVGSFECKKCPEGSSCNSVDPTIQSSCSSGQYSPAGSMNCYTCPAGSMCPNTKMAYPIPCPPGTYQSSTGQTSCLTCSTGTYSNIPGSITCNSLPSGHYSLSTKGASIPCPKGTYSTSSTTCSACTAGYICGIGESSAAPSYAKCPLGYYCPVVSGAVVLRPCSAGKYGTAEGAGTESAGCTDCSAGFYCPGGTALPIPCPEGTYCVAASSTPTLCGTGTYNKYKGKTSSGDCVSCVGGQLCPAGTTYPIDCPSGYYCPVGATSPTQCPAGTYMPLNNVPTKGVTASSDCVTCPKGHYCLIGSNNPTPCPIGTYLATTGATLLSQCTSCPAGKACPFQGITDVNAALDCAYGHYCPLGTQYPFDNACPAGKFSDSTSNTQSSDCTDCTAGYGCTAGANTFTNPPVKCAAGYYCPAGSASSTQNQCPAGYYSSNTGLSASSQCLNCPAGQYCIAGSISPTGLCSAGYWCPLNSGTATQNACAAGTYSASTGLKTSSECTVCPLGYICSSVAMTAPVKCAAGTYGAAAGLTGAVGSTCTTCPAGYYCPEGATTPTVCGKGKYSVAGAKDTGSPVCTKCPTGSYCAKDATADTDVTACAAGFICNIVAGTVGVAEVPYHPAYSCPAGQYCLQGATAGTPCPTGTYNPSVGGTSSANCLTTPAGYYADTTGTSSLSTKVCPAGYYCLAGATSSTTNPCPAGTYRNLVGAVQLSDCATCPTGYYCGKNTVSPVKCPQGYYCTNGVSEGTKCPAGYYGADSGLSAATDCTICPQGRYCSQAGLSAPDGLCDPGYYCASGSISPAPPTRRMLSSTGGVCPAGGYCEQGSKYPTRCPPGTFSTVAGISASSQCVTCTDGSYCIGTIDPNTSGLCTAGYYCNGGSTIPTQNVAQPGYYAPAGSANQIACLAGNYNPYYAQASCIACKKGYYCPSTGMSVMTDCPVGKYCLASATTTTSCPSGTYNDRIKATASTDCKACPPGQYCSGGGSTPSGSCTAGYYCRASATTPTPSGSGTNYGVCPAGYYCPAGTGDPLQCPPGTFNPNSQSTSSAACQTCTAGSYCSQPNLSAVEGPCTVGYYCPAGTIVKYPTTFCIAGQKCPQGSSAITTCIAGTYQNAPRQGICRACPAGYTCAAGATAFSASPCSIGKYCPAGSSTETSCPTGTYNPYQKKTSSSDCINCDPGSYCSGTGLTAVSGTCTAGYYCTLASTTATPTSGAGGQCQIGYYCPAGATVPLPCPPKQYCSTVGLSAPQGNCLAGYYCVGQATRNNPTSLASHGGAVCPAGYYCQAGTSSPTPCPPGSYRSSTGGQASTDCTTCPAGSYCSSFGGTAVSGSCQAGYYCPAGSSVSNSVICPAGSKCPAGSGSATACSDPEYQDQKGQSTCKTCAAGYICTATTRTLCRPDQSSLSFYCPANQYASVSCSTGTITNIIGATAQSDCVSCPPGYYCPNSASLTKTVQCPAGFYCSGGASKGDGTGSGAGVCPIGYYCPAGTNAPILCTPGKYCATTGLQTPTGDCTAGYYCLEGSSTATPSSGAMGGPCPAGSYCVAGSSIYIQCAVGTYNPNTGSTSSAACVTCDAGKKCLSRGLTAPSTNCPAGYYCTQNPYTLKACEQGYYCPSGSSSQTKCPSGQYQANTLQSSCDICPVGYYCPQSDTTRKIICPAGSYCVSGQAAATACPTGTYGPREGLQSSSACEQCPNGKYCGTTGLTSTGTDCTAGYYCTRGSSSATQNICPIGYYCPAGTTAPVPCPAGTYNDLTGKGLLTDCKSCPAGKFCPDAAMTAAPTTSTYNCAAGFICLGGAKTKYPLDGVTGRLCNKGYYCSSGATADTICQDGTYNPYSGMIACINCPKGYYCDKTKDTTTKIACPAGNYCPAGTPGTINKYQCPAGTYSANTKLSASADCTPCDPGKYCLIGSTGVSGNCAAGYVCPRGASVSNPSATFSFDGTDSVNFNKPGKCPTGHRCPSASYYPIPCDDGTYQDLEAQSVCKSCPAGNYCDSTGIISVSSKACEAGHYCSGGTKVKKPIKTTHSGSICSSGKYCPAGTTTELSCPAGYYDKRKGSPQCMTCPAGYYCPLGSTEPTVCPATMYCTAGVGAGTYCTAGTYNTADGLESAAQCRPCPVSKYCTSGQIQGSCDSGYFCDSGANASNDDSKKCPKNAYCEAGTAAPVRCESGKVNPNFYGNSPSSCVTCTAGYYCPETGDGAQITCPKGYYCVAGVTQPTACPVGTYVGSTGSTSSSSCTTCGAGYLCNVEGVGTIADFSCPVGYYCTAGSKNPTKCPAGTYRNTVGAGASTDCAQCPGGFYCTEGTISPIICPSGTYCPAGSTKTTACTAGYYCPPQTTTPINCPQAYYCPEGIETYIKCNNGTYCPTNSASPTLCPGGTFGNGNPNNYNSAVACVQCDAGTYTTTATPGDCLPCTAGYVCLGNTITATPVTSSTDNGYECPVGYYCPTGSSKEIACPAGTYTDTKRTGTLSGCKSCPAGSYNDQIGQKGCKQCGGTATSSIGAKSCTCKGIGREYQAGNGECLCAKGYSKADKTTDINSDQNCELSTTITCSTGYVADITGTTCLTESAYCQKECSGQGSGTGTYIASLKKCQCDQQGDYDAGCSANSCTSNRIIKYGTDGKVKIYQSDGTTQIGSSYDPSSVSGVYGTFTCTRTDGSCTSTRIGMSGSQFVYDFKESAVLTRILRDLGYKEEEKPVRRDLATVTTITNPTTCVIAGNMVEFSVNSSTKSYPVYMSNSLLNTNPSFDYSGFTNLKTTVEAGTATISVYVFTFSTAGTYVFMNSLDNYQQTIIKVVASTATCSSTTTVSATTLSSLYSLNLSTTTSTSDVDMTFFIQLVATKIGLLVFLVAFITYMHSINKNWTLCPCLRRKKEEDEDEKKKREELEKKKRAVQLKAEELRQIRDELAKHVEALKRRIAEVEQARLKKLKDKQKSEMQTNHTKLMNTLKLLKQYVKKRAKCIRNETGYDFEKDKNNFLIHRKFAGEKNEEQNLWELKKKKEMGDEDKFKLPEHLKKQIDEEVENKGYQKLSKAQEDNRQQVSNFYDEERRKLEERLRREGKLSENEIENILNDYDMHTRDMAIMLQEDEQRQQENFRKQLEARKKRRIALFDEIEQLKEERKRQKLKDAQDKKEEQDAMDRQLIDEEKELRKKMEKEIDDKKNASLMEFKNKLKKNKDKDNFKDLLEEYSKKEKEVEADLYNERNRALANIQAKLNERKRVLSRKLEIEKEDIIGEKIEAKIALLKKEAEDEASEILEEERRKKKIQAQLSLMRKENDEFINHLRDVNQEKYDDFCKELDQKYDENKLGKLIDVNSGGESIQSMREELADLFSLIKRTKNPEEIAKYQQRIEELKKLIADADKDGKLEEKIKKNNKLLQERAKLVEERESKKKEFKWKQFEEEEKERDKLLEKERQEWLKKEKEAIDAVVNKFFDKGDTDGLAEVLDQVYGAGSKVYSDRLFDLNNKLQEKKARRLKYNFNSNLDNKIHDIEELNRVMNPQLERLNSKKYLIPEDDYKNQLKDLMMKENEKRAEIEAMAANREQDSQSKTMLHFVDQQKDMIDNLNVDMKELREYAFKPEMFKDKHMKNELKKLNQKYDKELDKMKKDEEESKKKQIEDINERFKKGRDELEKNRRDFEMLGMFEKRLDDNRANEERFKMQNKKLMLDQLNKEKDKLGKELTDDEKAILLEKYERKMKNLNKALEKEYNRQTNDHSKQLADKIRELEMKKRERELLLNSLSMYKDSRAQQIANEDNFERLANIIEEDLELIDHEAYSYKPMKIYDLIKWKRETDEFLDALGGDATLLERVRRIEKYVGNLDTSSYNRIKKLIEKIKKR